MKKERQYNVDSLREGIVRAKANILMFESAIEKEKQMIADYRRMIKDIQEKNDAIEEAKKNVEIVVE